MDGREADGRFNLLGIVLVACLAKIFERAIREGHKIETHRRINNRHAEQAQSVKAYRSNKRPCTAKQGGGFRIRGQ